MRNQRRWTLPKLAGSIGALALIAAAPYAAGTASADDQGSQGSQGNQGGGNDAAAAYSTSSPIKHLVVIFQENVSFDHYFGTYPMAANPSGEPRFSPAPGTPSVNGLGDPAGALRTANPNLSNPQRLDRSQALTCGQDHDYTAEQSAFDHGLMDRFVQDTGSGKTVAQCTGQATGTSPNYAVMDYYDGNTVTGMWNYAQHFSMSDNSYGTTFGPSTPGAINVTGANTYGAICGPTSAVYQAPACANPTGTPATGPSDAQPQGPGTNYSDADPYYDVCSNGGLANSAAHIQMGGHNIGDLLDAAGLTWGWFQGGFASPGYQPGNPSSDDQSKVCTGTTPNISGAQQTDYSPHHEPFQYYASTANPQHLPPTSVAAVGHQDQANHQYDLRDFFAAADSGNLPALSYLKAPKAQDGHSGYSDPLDEQKFIVGTINHLEQLPTWKSTAVVISYDDSDGWYDHQMGPIVTQSQTSLDSLTDPGMCGTGSGAPSGQEARCGVGPRLPLLVVSPYSQVNAVDSTFTDQSSIVRFVEDNWLSGQRIGQGAADATAGTLDSLFDFSRPAAPKLFLDPTTGQPDGGDES